MLRRCQADRRPHTVGPSSLVGLLDDGESWPANCLACWPCPSWHRCYQGLARCRGCGWQWQRPAAPPRSSTAVAAGRCSHPLSPSTNGRLQVLQLAGNGPAQLSHHLDHIPAVVWLMLPRLPRVRSSPAISSAPSASMSLRPPTSSMLCWATCSRCWPCSLVVVTLVVHLQARSCRRRSVWLERLPTVSVRLNTRPVAAAAARPGLCPAGASHCRARCG